MTATGVFDAHHAPARALIDACVHCGFCLPACPTYRLWGEEADSPRGRILLMDLALRGAVAMDDTLTRHWDACLGCMACVPACPSGVRYDRLIESTRQQVERLVPRSRRERLWRAALFSMLPHAGRMRVAGHLLAFWRSSGAQRRARRSGIAGLLPARLRTAESLAPALRRSELRARVPATVAARGPVRRRVGLLRGCVQAGLFPHVNVAAARLLAAYGCEVISPPAQGCCGALELHAGREVRALERARRLIATFEAAQVDSIVVDAAGCGSVMKDWGALLDDDAQWAGRAARAAAMVRDVTELLGGLEPAPGVVLHPLPMRVAYWDACHLAHAQGIRSQPRALLARIPGLDVVEVSGAESCCGSAGVYNLLEPRAATELGRRAAAAVASTGADAVVAANPGCLLQIGASAARRGDQLVGFHPVELLGAALAGRDASVLLRDRRALIESAGRPRAVD